MSQINVNTITDEAGTGPVTVTDGLNVSSGNVLVGTTSNYAENVQAAFYGASNGGISLASGTSGLSRLMFADGVAGTAGAYAGSIIYSHADDSMRFNVNGGTERMRILSTGGITFNGDTAAANALDDYEEGTFTYSLPCSVSGGYYPRAGYATGYYTKVGRIVSITLRYESQGSSSPSGQLQLSNLPFVFISTIASGSPAFGWPILIRGANNNGDFASAFFNAAPATSYGGFYKQLANGTYAVLSNNDVASNFEGQMNFSYVTS